MFSAQFDAILTVVMKRWSLRQFLALFLAVFVTVGMSLSTVQASGMSAKMTMTSGMDVSGCCGCPAGGSGGMKAMSCASMCVAPVLAVFPQAAPLMLINRPASFTVLNPLLRGKAATPDPYPPRPIDIV